MDEKICVVGLGYVGLPLALALSEKFECIGFDINNKRISDLSKHIDSNSEHSSAEISNAKLQVVEDLDSAADCSVFIVTVPTPITENKAPDLNPLALACQMVGQVLKKKDLVVFESTVYPGCSENFCGPLLEEASGLVSGEEFSIGYSPERINPGDKSNTIKTIKKIVSGDSEEALERVSYLYSAIITAGIYQAKSIKVAEAAKLTENIQRDVNIALMNELAKIYSEMELRISDVLDAAVTKWNFIPFRPGLVGGHCIGVDPYYLIDSAKKIDLKTPLISIARQTNEEVVQRILKFFQDNVPIAHGKSLFLGLTFKENCNDLRNSKALELAVELSKLTIVHALEPNIERIEDADIKLVDSLSHGPYDSVTIAVRHNQFLQLKENEFCSLIGPNGYIFDLHNTYELDYERTFTL